MKSSGRSTRDVPLPATSIALAAQFPGISPSERPVLPMIHFAKGKALRAAERERLAAVSASAAGPLPSALVEEMESSNSDDEGSRKRARPENPENRVPIPIAGMHRARRGTVVNNAGESCFLSRPSRVLHYHSPVLSQPDVQQLSRKGVQSSSCGNRGSTSSWMASNERHGDTLHSTRFILHASSFGVAAEGQRGPNWKSGTPSTLQDQVHRTALHNTTTLSTANATQQPT